MNKTMFACLNLAHTNYRVNHLCRVSLPRSVDSIWIWNNRLIGLIRHNLIAPSSYSPLFFNINLNQKSLPSKILYQTPISSKGKSTFLPQRRSILKAFILMLSGQLSLVRELLSCIQGGLLQSCLEITSSATPLTLLHSRRTQPSYNVKL